jgi:hypothetical protein
MLQTYVYCSPVYKLYNMCSFADRLWENHGGRDAGSPIQQDALGHLYSHDGEINWAWAPNDQVANASILTTWMVRKERNAHTFEARCSSAVSSRPRRSQMVEMPGPS